MAEPMRILIADDHAVLRSGLKMLLEAEPDMEVVGEAPDGPATIAETERLRPDVVLLDITMPGGSGLTAMQAIADAYPRTRILVLTMHDEVGYLRQCFEAGAAGYVLKSTADTELVAAIRAVHRGEQFVDPAVVSSTVLQLLGVSSVPAGGVAGPPLSAREQEVLPYIARGYTSREAADELHISPKTVETYRLRVMQKLGLRTRAELVEYALRHGLI